MATGCMAMWLIADGLLSSTVTLSLLTTAIMLELFPETSTRLLYEELLPPNFASSAPYASTSYVSPNCRTSGKSSLL